MFLEANYTVLSSNTAPLEERVDLFVDRSWDHFSSPLYRSIFQILLNLPPDLEPSWQNLAAE